MKRDSGNTPAIRGGGSGMRGKRNHHLTEQPAPGIR
jgi:hypothetical protein